MLFDEKEMLEICKKYDIEAIEKDGYPLYNDQEMDENFSISNILNNSSDIDTRKKNIYLKTIDLDISISFEEDNYTNCSLNELAESYFVKMNDDVCYRAIESLITSDSNIIIAA